MTFPKLSIPAALNWFAPVGGPGREVRVSSSKSSLAALTLGAIGVVYGDIGTSPLYAFKEVFGGGHVPITADNVLGVLSLFFWTLTVVVSIKYVVLIMRADNAGEGGLMALLALASQSVKDQPRLRGALLILGVFGVALFFGDGIITPAISVLSAVEGLEVITPAAKPYVVPISLLVLFALFAAQKRGTGDIGKFFGPVTVLWFLAIAATGVALGQSVYYAIGTGATQAVIFQLAGRLYGEFGQSAFLGMFAVSAIGIAALILLARVWKGNVVVGA